MRLINPFTESDCDRARQAHLTPDMFARATFEAVRVLDAFRQNDLDPAVRKCPPRTARTRAIVGLHFRIAAYLASVAMLDGPVHFQSIASAARSVFELALDIHLLHRDATDESAERLEAFTRVERFRVAQKTVTFYEGRPDPPDFSLTRQREICADATEAADVERLVDQYWGRNRKGELNWPRHWSQFSDARGRAHDAGQLWEERYVRSYYRSSWHVHPGVVGSAYMSLEAFVIFAAEAHRLIADCVVESYRVIGQELQLDQAIAKWAEQLDFLDNWAALALLDQKLQSLGEPARLSFQA